VRAEPLRPGLGRVVRLLGLLAVIGFVAVLVYGVLGRSPDTTIDDALARREAVPAPGFALDVLTAGDPGPLAGVWQRAAGDGRVNLRELRGTPVVINFWASWCVPCREEAPILRRGWHRARSRGVLFVGLNMQDIRSDAREFVRELGQDYPHVRDPTNDTARRWGATGIPETFFVSRRGEIVGHVIGALSEAQLADGVDAALTGRPQRAGRGGARRATR
jgi:cytochrome c biogenesis protein CcmG, thiol:disulfide interchange protein DsbE